MLRELAFNLMQASEYIYKLKIAEDFKEIKFTSESIEVENRNLIIADLDKTNFKHDELWKHFGFQSSNPRTDFRASGFLGLVQFDFFARTQSESVKESFQMNSDLFFLACPKFYLLEQDDWIVARI